MFSPKGPAPSASNLFFSLRTAYARGKNCYLKEGGEGNCDLGLASVFATWARFCLPVVRVIGLAFSLPVVRLQAGLASNSPPDCSPTAKLRAPLCRFKQKTQSRGLGFPFDTATWARTKDLLLRRQLLYPTELLPPEPG